jgi:DNA helicase-2/ATP-dependent DNA helicase PcrA
MTTPADKDASFLAALNAEQRAAAEHLNGPLRVIAGAGTGKTKTLAARVANLIHHGADPSTILLLTFTRRAAGEMIRRAGQVVGAGPAAGVWGGTFHAVAHRLLRIHHQALGLNPNFVVMDQADAQDLLHLVRTDLQLHQSVTRFPQKGTLLAIYSRVVNTGVALPDVIEDHFPWCEACLPGIKAVFQGYAEGKAERHLLDYDDLLLYWDQALASAGVGPFLADRFRHLLVDEYQDTNALQAAILEKMWNLMGPSGHDSPKGTPRSIMVVGDDAQAIYSFRGGTVSNILHFHENFPGTTTLCLEQNYRSITPILQASNAVMEPASERFTKNLWSKRTGDRKPLLVTCEDELAQSAYIASRILEHREEGLPLMKQAVLFRAGHNSDALEIELGRRNIPFVKWGGLKFLESAHIKDLLAFLRILENSEDDLSWMRVLQLLDGIGPGRARQAVTHLRQHQSRPEALLSWQAPSGAADTIKSLSALLSRLGAKSQPLPLSGQIDLVRKYYSPLFQKRYDNPEVRLRDLDQLELLAQQANSRTSFLADLTLDPPTSTGDFAGPPHLDEEYVVLSTIHSAKGCEWDVIYIIHAADGVLPSDMVKEEEELEEERRLLYVAMTRARDVLYVTFPLKYYHRTYPVGDSYSTAQLTRFLPPSLFRLFERVSSASPKPADMPLPNVAGETAQHVRARLKKLFD